MLPATLSTISQTIVDLAKLGLFAYAIASGRTFLLRWLETRQGLPLFTTTKLTREQAIDAAKKYGITAADTEQV